MALYATVFEHQVYKESSSRHRMFTRKDSLEMQRLINSLARIVLRRGKRASTEQLMKDIAYDVCIGSAVVAGVCDEMNAKAWFYT